MVMAFVLALTAISLGQFDPLTLNLIDSPDMNAIGADHFHMFFDFGHSNLLCRPDNARIGVLFSRSRLVPIVVRISEKSVAMSASLIGRSGSSTFRLSTTAVSMSLTARASLRNRHQGPSIMGFEDEVEQSLGRPCRQTNGRSKRTCELTSPIVPRGTSFHRSVELECSPISCDPERFSCCCCFFPGPAELGAINPYAVHDHGQPARQRHDRLLHSAMPGDLHRPGLEPGPLVGAGQHDLGRFVEHHPYRLVPAL